MIEKTSDLSHTIRKAWPSDNDLDTRAGSLATINAIADAIYRHLDFKTLVERAVDVVLEYIPVHSAVIFTLDEANQRLDAVAWRGFDDDTMRVGSRLPVNASATGATVIQQDVLTDYDMIQN